MHTVGNDIRPVTPGFPVILPDTAAQTPTVPTVPVPPGLRSTAEVGMLLQLIHLADACSPFHPLLILKMIWFFKSLLLTLSFRSTACSSEQKLNKRNSVVHHTQRRATATCSQRSHTSTMCKAPAWTMYVGRAVFHSDSTGALYKFQ